MQKKRSGNQHGGPHEHNLIAAAIIANLRGHGITQQGISEHLECLQAEGVVDLGGQGYSLDTLQRHYRISLDVGAIVSRDRLLEMLTKFAMGEGMPQGVSPDAALRTMSDSIKWMLEKHYGEGAKGSPLDLERSTHRLPLERVREVLSIEEMGQLERILRKLKAAEDPARAVIDAR